MFSHKDGAWVIFLVNRIATIHFQVIISIYKTLNVQSASTGTVNKEEDDGELVII